MRNAGLVLFTCALLVALVVAGGGYEVRASGTRVHLPILHGDLQPTATPTATPTLAPSLADQVVVLVNRERTNRGLAPLEQVPALMQAAAGHSQDMASHDFFSHTGSDGADLGDRLHRVGYDWYTCGENIAAGYSSPEAVVAAWMNSAGHRDNMLRAAYRDVGAGYAYSSSATYGHYWTLDLASR